MQLVCSTVCYSVFTAQDESREENENESGNENENENETGLKMKMASEVSRVRKGQGCRHTLAGATAGESWALDRQVHVRVRVHAHVRPGPRPRPGPGQPSG